MVSLGFRHFMSLGTGWLSSFVSSNTLITTVASLSFLISAVTLSGSRQTKIPITSKSNYQ